MNNFKLIRDFCDKTGILENEDRFLFGQVMVRSKDGSRYSRSNNRIIKDITIRSVNDFDSKESEIVELCNLFEARAYININPRSFKSITIDMAGICLDYVRSGGEVACRSAFSTACGRSKPSGGYWVIDVDNMDEYDEVNRLVPKPELIVPTISGAHIICRGFDLRELRSKYPNVDIHKNNPTLLYAFKPSNQETTNRVADIA